MALPPLRQRPSVSAGALQALTLAQGRSRPRQDIGEVLKAQIVRASTSALTRVESLLPVATRSDEIHISDWGDGEALGGDPVPDDEDGPTNSFDPNSHLMFLEAGLDALSVVEPLRTAKHLLRDQTSGLAANASPPDTRPHDPEEPRPANLHTIDDDRTIKDSRDRFNKYDRDRDGDLNFQEVAKLFRDMEMDVDERTMDLVLRKFDADSSGTIDYDEFCKLCLFLNVGTQESAEEKQKLHAETARVEQSIPRYLKYVGNNHLQVAEMCEYCAGLMHRQGRLTASREMSEQAQLIRRTVAQQSGNALANTIARRKFADDD